MVQTRDRVIASDQSVTARSLQLEDQTVAALLKAGDLAFPGMDSSAPGAQVPLHLSMRAEVKYGLQPWQALQTMTILPARAYGYDKDLGSLEPGKLADLAIIDGNPLQNIADTIKVTSVIVNGRYYSTADLMAPFANK
jgi:imidazolonepropionase-like amidohydrolase